MKRFGESNVEQGEIDVGEGETEQGTILFMDSQSDRVEILWKDRGEGRNPHRVKLSINAPSLSRWKGPLGISTELRLQQLEAYNRKPFRIAGFAWDYSGTVLSWNEGEIETATGSACSFIVRLNPAPADRDLYIQEYNSVQGDREYSSGHPAMQRLNPKAYEFLLLYP